MYGNRELEAFVAVTDAGSVSLAATRLFRTQPTVSRQLAALEQQIGSQLFRRTSSGMTLTPVGEQLEPMARDLVRRGMRAVDVMQAVVTRQRSFIVACPELTGIALLAPFIVAGGAVSDIVISTPGEVYGTLRGTADFAVNTSPPLKGLQGMQLLTVPLLCQVAPGHPLAEGDHVELGAVVAEPFFTPGHGATALQLIQPLAEREGFALTLVTTANAPIAQARAVRGHGPAIVVDPPRFGLVSLPLWHRGHPLTGALYAGWEPGHYASDDIAEVARELSVFMKGYLSTVFAVPEG
jgi:DNA-binding transcriptional LysR family regulator